MMKQEKTFGKKTPRYLNKFDDKYVPYKEAL